MAQKKKSKGIPKTIQMESVPLDDLQKQQMDLRFQSWNILYNDLAGFVCSCANLGRTGQQIRDDLREPLDEKVAKKREKEDLRREKKKARRKAGKKAGKKARKRAGKRAAKAKGKMRRWPILPSLAGRLTNLTRVIYSNNAPASWMWTMVVDSLVMNKKTMDKQTAKSILQELHRKFEMTEDEHSSIHGILNHGLAEFRSLVTNNRFDLGAYCNVQAYRNSDASADSKKKIIKAVADCDPKRLEQMLRHAARLWRHWHKVPCTHKDTWMRVDKCAYDVRHDVANKKTIIRFMGMGDLKPFDVELKGLWFTSKKGRTQSNLTIVYDREKNVLRFCRTVYIQPGHPHGKEIMGVDMGMNQMFATSKEYSSANGQNRDFKEKLFKFSDQNKDRVQQRNKMRDRAKNLEQDIQKLDVQIADRSLGTEQKKELSNRRCRLRRKLERMRRCNLSSSRKFEKKTRKQKAHLRHVINQEIGLMLHDILHQDVKGIVVEDLEIRGRSKNAFRDQQRILSDWLYGVMSERLEYKASLLGLQCQKVNPAFTSQYCHLCHSEVERDIRDRSICQCTDPECRQDTEKKTGKQTMNADINAAYNILWISTQKVQKYTPHSEIKALFDRAFP